MNELMALSHPQKRIWYTEMTYLNTSYSCLANIVRYKEKFDDDTIKKAINLVVKNNDGLRLTLTHGADAGDDMQFIADYEEIDIDMWDYSTGPLRETLDARLSNEASRPFKIYNSRLYHFALVDFGDDGSDFSNIGVYFKLHHLVSDGWTIALVYNQILEYCKMLSAGREGEIKSNPSYTDYLKAERNYFNSAKYKDDEKFWLKEFSTPLDESSINYDKLRADSIDSERALFVVDDKLRSMINEFKTVSGSTVYKIILAAMFVYISRARGSKNVLISTAFHGRTEEFGKTAGMFVSTVPLRVEVDHDSCFLNLVRASGEKLNNLLKNHAAYPFDELVEKLRENKNPNTDTLLSAISVVGHPDDKDTGILLRNIYQKSEFGSITVHVNASGLNCRGRLEIMFDYQKEIFTGGEINAIFNSICAILRDAITNKDKPVGELELLNDNEKNRVLYDFNQTDKAFEADKTLFDLFNLSCKKYPENVAVKYGDISLTYAGLAEKVDALAQKLAFTGVGAEKICAIYAKRTHYYLIAILAILKAGGAYMPLDSSYPSERVEFMLSDANAAVFLTGAEFEGKINTAAPSFVIDDEKNYAAVEDGSRERVTYKKAEAGNLAYVIYTSGSTGKPKGVMIEHRSAVNMVCWSRDHYQIAAGGNCAEFASFAFDASVVQIFSPLSRGAALHILKDELRYSPAAANDYFEANNIVYVDLPTQFCEQFIREVNNHSLKNVSTGGEKLKITSAPANFKLTDEYGPTECSIVSTFYDIGPGGCGKTPIGKPIANTRIYILDGKKRLVPEFMPGELYIAGAGLARGYLNRPDLTDEKFTADPFYSGAKMYRTGDLARWLPDGNIDYLGRADFQVKIRGFRIELEEIQNEIEKHPLVESAAVANSKTASGEDFISAHVVLKKSDSRETLDASDFKKFLASTLPAYMIPSRFCFIDKMPLTSGGKIDKKALLAAMPAEAHDISFHEPQGETEKKAAQIWRGILNINRISRDDDFFELGGHSLKAASLQGLYKKAFGVQLSLQEIFKISRLSEQAALIDKKSTGPAGMIEKAAPRDYYPLSAAQKRLFIIESMGGTGIAYNLTSSFIIKGALDITRLANSFDMLVKRHETLRSRFIVINGEAVIKIEREVKYKRNYREASENELKKLIHDFVKPFDISKAPLFRILLVKLSGERHLFAFDAHHIILDGISVKILMEELCSLYEGRAPEEAPYDFTDFTVWQEKLQRDAAPGSLHEKYWLDRFSGEIPVLDIPADRPRGAAISYAGGRIFIDINDSAADLEKLSSLYSATNFNVLLSLFFVTLHKFSAQNDITAGIPASGRTAAEFESVAGMFVNTIAIRAKPSPEKKFKDFVDEVKNDFALAMDNSDYQFESLVEKLAVGREAGRNPLFDVMFACEYDDKDKLKAGEIEFENYMFDPGISKFDLTMFCISAKGSLKIGMEYKTVLFDLKTAERILDGFAAVIKNAAADPGALIGSLSAVSESARQRILIDYNSTAEDFNEERPLIELIERMAAADPHAVALVCADKSMSYAEMDSKAEKLARLLYSKHGAASDVIFGILAGRSFETVIAILAVLKCGAAYLPIDPAYPAERIEYIIADSGIKTLLTQGEYLASCAGKADVVDITGEKSYAGEENAFKRGVSLDDIIYVIYTSGSTGRPKGVLVRQKGALNYILWCKKVYADNRACDFPLYSSISFDLTVTSIFTPLVTGGKIVIYPERAKETLIDRIIADDCVDIVKLTPTHLQIIENMDVNCRRIKKLIVGGEDLKADTCEKIFEKFNKQVSIFNEYGPTETTVGCMIYRYTPADFLSRASSVAIGRPAANTMIYILDSSKKLLPEGAKGEIYISGAGVARGYRNKSDLTAERFLSNPFAPGAVMYKSGDLARFKPDGNIEFLGRIDEQIKLRGYRIETGEIETELIRHPGVKDAAVVLRDDKRRGRYLAAYFTLNDRAAGAPVKTDELKRHLAERLPLYFVPDAFMALDKIPLTPNGKTDKKSLPDPFENSSDRSNNFAAPESAAEIKIAAVWRTVLGVDKIGVDDNFFSLGGHSLKAVRAVMELSGDFVISVNDIFERQTIRTLAAGIKPASGNLKSKLNALKYFKPKPHAFDDELIKSKLNSYSESVKKYENIDLSEVKKYGTILLCGATGYLGSYLLNETLLKRNETIYMIIRAKNSAEALTRLREKYEYYFGQGSLEKYFHRVKVFAGDLSENMLGLESSDYGFLCDCVDCVINSAANVRHFGHYNQFHEANVVTVENLVKFCLAGKKKDLNHVSTMSVAAGDIEGAESVLFTEDDLDIGQKSGNYYLETKLAGEKAAAAARESGIGVNIFRAGNLTFDSRNGLCQQNIEENAFYKILKSLALLGAVPETLDQAEFSFVDRAACAMLSIFDKKALENQTYHILNDKAQKLSELLSSEETGLDIDVLDFKKYMELMIGYSDDNKFRPLIDELLFHRGWIEEMSRGTNCCVRSDKTNFILSKLGFSWREARGADCFGMLKQAFGERVRFLKRQNLFTGLTEDTVVRFALLTREGAFKTDEEIAWENTPSLKAHIIIDGLAEISAHSKNMWLGTLEVLSEGGLIGFDSAFNDKMSGVIAGAVMGPMRSLYISSENLMSFAQKNPLFTMNLARYLSEKVSNCRKIIVNMG